MKKIISLLLALIMMFSMCTVAFAADATTENEGGESSSETAPPVDEDDADVDSLLGEYDWILDLPFGTVKPALKIAKIVLKLAKVYVKLGVIFGIIDKDALVEQIGDFIGGLIGGEEAPETQEPAPEESTAPAA